MARSSAKPAGRPRRVPGPAEVTGLVLCGGESRRMGRDKALIELGGRRLIEYPLEALRAVAGRVLISTGSSVRYADLGCEVVLDTHAGVGPLAGLLAGLEAARTEWVAVLACDMPRAVAPLMRELLAEALASEADACLLELERGSQPLYAAYRRSCAASVRRALESGERRMVSFHDGLRIVGLDARKLGPDAALAAANVNTLADLALLTNGAQRARGPEAR